MQLGNLIITDNKSRYIATQKIYYIACELGMSKINASKISALSSEIYRAMGSNLSVKLSYRKKASVDCLLLCFSGSLVSSIPHACRYFFDLWEEKSIHHKGEGQIFAEKEFVPISIRSQDDLFESCVKIINRKSRDELLKDLEEKNLALEKWGEELKHAKAAAESAAEIRSVFLANMSHEIRTPMNGILGFTNLLLKDELTQKQYNYLKKIQSSGNSLLGIINDILDFSKIEAGKLQIEKTEFYLTGLMEEIGGMFAEQAGHKGIDLTIAVNKNVPVYLKGDPLRLKQILMNLTSNAIKFTHEGHVSVLVECEKLTNKFVNLSFRVTDTGIGISKENISKLFSPFTQADGSTTRKFGGTGLGLAICKQLVTLMNGSIDLTSKLGKGTTFKFELSFEIDEHAFSQVPKSKGSVDLKKLKILVIDDFDVSRQVQVEMLTSFGVTVLEAVSAETGIKIMEQESSQKHPFDLVLMDWKMPGGMNGIQAASVISEDPGLNSIPIVIVSAYISEGEMKEKHKGVHSFLSKPVMQSTLLNLLLELFGAADKSKVKSKSFNLMSDNFKKKLLGSKILLAEDNLINQEVATDFLTEVGVDLTIVDNGIKAVEAIRNEKWDAVLMDMQMPDMDGYTATKEIRKHAEFAQLPIIAMTANAMSGDRDKCMEAGMNDYITKPFAPVELYSVLTKWIKREYHSRFSDMNEQAMNEEKYPDNCFLTDQAVQWLREHGIDATQALKTMSNKANLYEKVLQRFFNSIPETIDQLFAAMQSDDWETARRLAHSTKGLAGTIGATKLFDQSLNLEISLKNGTNDIPLLHGYFVEEMMRVKEVLDHICKMKTEQSKQKDIKERSLSVDDFSSISQLLDQLTNSLDEDLGLAVDLCRQLCQFANNTIFSDETARIEEAVQGFDFDTVRKYIADLRQQLNNIKQNN